MDVVNDKDVLYLKVPYEPKMEHRWYIKVLTNTPFKGGDINSYLFKNYTLYNDGSKLCIDFNFIESLGQLINPLDMFNIIGLAIHYVSPTGVWENGIQFDIKGLNFVTKGDYSSDELKVYECTAEIDKKTLKMIFPEK